MASFAVPGDSKPLSQRIFEKYDLDGSGEIDVAEFHKMVRDQGIYLSEDALALAIMELDRNGDCKISYEEYKVGRDAGPLFQLSHSHVVSCDGRSGSRTRHSAI